MRVLGISAFYHDSAAAVVEDGRRKGTGNSRRWWHNSAMALNRALPNTISNRLGVPTLAS